MQRAPRRPTGVRDRFLASDPGLMRLLSALSTVGAVLLTLGTLRTLHAPVPTLVAAALTALVSTAAVTEPRPHDQAVTLAAGVPVALATVTVGSALAPYRIAAHVVFVALIFAAVYVRRWGPCATSLGIFPFQLFFVTQFVGTRLEQLPQLCPAVLVAFGSSALVRFALLRSPPERTLARLHRAFLLQLGLVLDALIAAVEGGPEAPRTERALHDLRRHAARLHAGALLIQKWLGPGAPDRCTATAIQHRVAEAETAVERLAVLVMRLLRPSADIDTLTGYVAKARPAGSSVDARDPVTLPGADPGAARTARRDRPRSAATGLHRSRGGPGRAVRPPRRRAPVRRVPRHAGRLPLGRGPRPRPPPHAPGRRRAHSGLPRLPRGGWLSGKARGEGVRSGEGRRGEAAAGAPPPSHDQDRAPGRHRIRTGHRRR